jgi:stage V sporulation protein B
MQNMLPTAISQVTENFMRVVVGLSLAYFLMPDIGKAAGGASFGAVAGGVFGSLILWILYHKMLPKLNKEIASTKNKSDSVLSFKRVAKTILAIAIPISIGAAVNSVMNFVDSACVTARLLSVGLNEIDATASFGQLTKVATFINLPLTFGMAIVAGLVPAISEAMAKKDYEEVQGKIELGARFALLISLPASIGLAVLAAPIMAFIYPGAPGGAILLAVGALSIAFVMLGQAFTGILQGMGSVWTPVKALGLAAVVKIVFTIYLVGTSLQVIGASVASIIAYAVFMLYNYLVIKKQTHFALNYRLVLVKPLLSAGVMGIAAWAVYQLGKNVLSTDSFLQNAILTLGAVGVGAVVYVIMLLVTGGFTKQDINEIRGKKEK